MNTQFYICRHCGNIIMKIKDAGVPVVCCGEKMALLAPNTVEASAEKHLPVATMADGVLTVSVGSVAHPMTAEHSITWIYVETAQGGILKHLKNTDAPQATFALGSDVPTAVYAYCNLHGLWAVQL